MSDISHKQLKTACSHRNHHLLPLGFFRNAGRHHLHEQSRASILTDHLPLEENIFVMRL